VSYQPPPWALDIITRIEGIGKRLDKLDIIESNVHIMKHDIKSVNDRVSEIEKSQEFVAATWENVKTSNEAAKQELSDIRKTLENTMKDNARITGEIVDLQCRSMRDNLMFYNIEECETENCMDVIQELARDKLKLTEIIEIDRAHRIGRVGPGKIRPIVAKFRNYQQRENIRKSARLLNGSNYYIGEQFPRSIQERRRQLLPAYKRARSDGKKASLVRDRLYIEGIPYRDDESTARPTPRPRREMTGDPADGGARMHQEIRLQSYIQTYVLYRGT
jgi:DNA repair exonuclease SbcCD ATPase subunit